MQDLKTDLGVVPPIGFSLDRPMTMPVTMENTILKEKRKKMEVNL